MKTIDKFSKEDFIKYLYIFKKYDTIFQNIWLRR